MSQDKADTARTAWLGPNPFGQWPDMNINIQETRGELRRPSEIAQPHPLHQDLQEQQEAVN